MGDVKTLVDAKIAGKKVMVFSKSYCPYCAKAKKALQRHVGKELEPEDYEIMEIESLDNCGQIQNYLRKLTGSSSVPRVFINGKCIGGGDETVAAESNGKLVKMLTS